MQNIKKYVTPMCILFKIVHVQMIILQYFWIVINTRSCIIIKCLHKSYSRKVSFQMNYTIFVLSYIYWNTFNFH